jgi:hypothetical protein
MKDKMEALVTRNLGDVDKLLKKRLSKIAKTVAKLEWRAESLRLNFQAELESLSSQMQSFAKTKPTHMGYLPSPPSTYPDSCKWHEWSDSPKSVDFDIKYNIMPTVIPGASSMPENEIERPTVVDHDLRPWPVRTFQMTLDQSKQLRRQKQVCASIIHGRFGMLVRGKDASNAFAAALEAALA